MAIWALIIVATVLAYGFKDDLIAIVRVGEGSVGDDQTITFRRGGDGHFYARLSVNGEDMPFLIDTGATDLVLTRKAAAAVGFDVGRLAFTQQAKTANGVVSGAPVVLDSVTLGPFTDRNVRAIVNGGDLHTPLLGMNYLDRFRSFRIEGDRLILVR